jgi:hypothetical protein
MMVQHGWPFQQVKSLYKTKRNLQRAYHEVVDALLEFNTDLSLAETSSIQISLA